MVSLALSGSLSIAQRQAIERESSGARKANLTIDYSCVEGFTGTKPWSGNGNIGDDPDLIDADGADGDAGTADDDVRLQDVSRCIDAGNKDDVSPDTLDGDGDTTESTPFDFDGCLRILDVDGDQAAVVDMGAHERSDCNDSNIADSKDILVLSSEDHSFNGHHADDTCRHAEVSRLPSLRGSQHGPGGLGDARLVPHSLPEEALVRWRMPAGWLHRTHRFGF